MSVISATGFGKLPRLKLSWIIVVVALLLPVHVYGQEELTTETVGEIERIIHDYLMEHPEVIIESVQKLREKQEAMEMDEGTQNLRAFRDQLENDGLGQVCRKLHHHQHQQFLQAGSLCKHLFVFARRPA